MKRYPMRRKDRQLAETEALQIIENGEYGILSLTDSDGTPYGVPLNYCCVEGKIYFHGTNFDRVGVWRLDVEYVTGKARK